MLTQLQLINAIISNKDYSIIAENNLNKANDSAESKCSLISKTAENNREKVVKLSVEALLQ